MLASASVMVRRSTPGVLAPALPATRPNATSSVAGREVEQVIEPAAWISRRSMVKLGLHPRYPRPRPLQIRDVRGDDVHRRVFRHDSLLPCSIPLPSFPMCRAFPGSEYYDGSAPSRPDRRSARPAGPCGSGARSIGGTRMVPVCTVIRSTKEEPDSAPQHHHGFPQHFTMVSGSAGDVGLSPPLESTALHGTPGAPWQDQPGGGRPGGQIHQIGGLGHPGALADATVCGDGRIPRVVGVEHLGGLADRGADHRSRKNPTCAARPAAANPWVPNSIFLKLSSE